MSQQLELLTENPAQWKAISYVAPEIQKKEIKPFVVLALKELECQPDARTASLMSADRFACVRAVVRHVARARSARSRPRAAQQWDHDALATFLHGLGFTAECAAELGALLSVEEVFARAPAHLRVKPRLRGLSWKIDLSRGQAIAAAQGIQGSEAAALTRRHACIVLSLRMADTDADVDADAKGNSRAYRLTPHAFHALRFTLAAALKNMIVLERRRCMRE